MGLFVSGMIVGSTWIFSPTGVDWEYAFLGFIGSIVIMSFFPDKEL